MANLHGSRLVLIIVIAARLGAATALSISGPTGLDSSSDTLPTSILYTEEPTANPSNTVSIAVASSVPPHSGHDYAIDPFGVLGQDQPQETTSGRISPFSLPTFPETEGTHKSNSATSGHEATTSTQSNAITFATDITSTGTMSSSPSSSAPESTTQTVNITSTKGSGGNANSGSSMNSWKIIGIGVLAFAGIATLILGFTFHDTWWGTFLRPIILGKRGRRTGDEQLIPDWDRRSWAFGDEAKTDASGQFSIVNFPSVFKPNGRKDTGVNLTNEQGIGQKNEKRDDALGNLVFPLPLPGPEPPFAIRRAPSTSSNKDTNRTPNATDVKNNEHSIIPSFPPSAQTPAIDYDNLNVIGLPSIYPQPQYPSPAQDKKARPAIRKRASLKATHCATDESDAYGGIEDAGHSSGVR